jgi:hypothetical protein
MTPVQELPAADPHPVVAHAVGNRSRPSSDEQAPALMASAILEPKRSGNACLWATTVNHR